MNRRMANRYIYCGIIGAICFGVGDWLLGYVDISPVPETAFGYLRVGHGAAYDTEKAVITMLLGTVGMVFYYPALAHMGDIVKNKAVRKMINGLFGATAFACILIHYFYTVNVFCYAWMMQNGGEALAGELSIALENALTGSVLLGCFLLIIPHALHLFQIATGRTSLKKITVCFHPLVWMLIINIIGNILPESSFSYGLFTFCVNAGMLVWCFYLLLTGGGQVRKSIR